MRQSYELFEEDTRACKDSFVDAIKSPLCLLSIKGGEWRSKVYSYSDSLFMFSS